MRGQIGCVRGEWQTSRVGRDGADTSVGHKWGGHFGPPLPCGAGLLLGAGQMRSKLGEDGEMPLHIFFGVGDAE